MPQLRLSASRGFSLVEALIASLIIATAVVGLAHLVALGAGQSQRAREHVVALLSAQSKLEQLRSASHLVPSPHDSLDSDSAGYVDNPSVGFVRRWAITLLDVDDPRTFVIRACVFPTGRASAVSAPNAACVATIRTTWP